MTTEFRLWPLRFSLTPASPLRFENGMAGNVVRGALGSVADKQHPLYSRFYGSGGSAPYVLRARHLNSREIAAGEPFEIGINLFLAEGLDYLTETVRRWELTGLGPGRSPVRLVAVHGAEPLNFSLKREASPSSMRIQIRFETPTELKSGGVVVDAPDFLVLFARLRDRIGRLSELYGDGPIARDESLTQQAQSVRLVDERLTYVSGSRFSSRTGQLHPIGGFAGSVDYEGALDAFLPFLELGSWIGVGRQTSWGKGEFTVEHILRAI